jgi:hypothetical protein
MLSTEYSQLTTHYSILFRTLKFAAAQGYGVQVSDTTGDAIYSTACQQKKYHTMMAHDG